MSYPSGPAANGKKGDGCSHSSDGASLAGKSHFTVMQAAFRVYSESSSGTLTSVRTFGGILACTPDLQCMQWGPQPPRQGPDRENLLDSADRQAASQRGQSGTAAHAMDADPVGNKSAPPT